jgi:DNA-binding CsgD family transcriptional regulator
MVEKYKSRSEAMSQKNAMQQCIDAYRKINQVCEPLFKTTPICWFGYSRECFNGDKITIGNHPDWLEHYYQKTYFRLGPKDYYEFYRGEFMLWDPLENDVQIRDAKGIFDICHGITLFRKDELGVDIFHFAPEKNNVEIANWYVNHLNLLKKFGRYFCGEMKGMLHKMPSIMSLEDRLLLRAQFNEVQLQATAQTPEIILQSTWSPGEKYKDIILSRREIDLTIQLLRGNTAKHIAKTLCLSPRTIEFYLQRMKKKFKCHTKTELINIILTTSFADDLAVFTEQ